MWSGIDLRQCVDMSLGREVDDLPEIVAGVEAGVRPAVVVTCLVGTDEGLPSPGSDLGEPRVALDLDPPALIVGQVQVEDIALVKGNEVDEDEGLKELRLIQ
jgi:hypothetical protein